ncbi:hypothetical protein [Ruegeria sp.]|uniref:hypothetical protein n=1 Tax=Ruegeria sp. TaxID=1879320 RepID=UPI00231B0F86|nr:hypothetical protein [Ruegeria sp.]MDA7965989.1 hypothetical protein [Ruegeria sp.]
MKPVFAALAMFVTLVLGACSTPQPVQRSDIDGLTNAIQALGPDVDPNEARRAAEISYSYSQQLAQEWNVTDPAIIHNAKVINGFREHGLCNDWAQAMTRRLRQEDFRTLQLHWATSPPTPFRIIHHSALISARGDGIEDGIILDPWRNSGRLHWAPTREDTRYNWRPRLEVREELLNGELSF